MAIYSANEYTDMLLCLGACQNVARHAAAEYARRFPNRRHPHHLTIQRLEQRIRETGSLIVHKPDVGRQRGPRVERQEEVLQAFADDPTTSVRRTARRLHMKKSTVHRIVRDDHLHDFKYRRVQGLRPGDDLRRMQYCNMMLHQYEADNGFLNRILWTDESKYGRMGISNPHNAHFYDHQNPHCLREDRFQNRYSVNMWAGMIGDCLIGPIELPDILTGENYLQFLQDDLPDLLDQMLTRDQQDGIIFMHDGAGPHNTRIVRNYLDRRFPGSWIGYNGPIAWPARSPDLNPLDFFFWGNSKEVVYRDGDVPTAEEIRIKIQDHADNVLPEMVQNAVSDVVRRARACLAEDGRHFEHLPKRRVRPIMDDDESDDSVENDENDEYDSANDEDDDDSDQNFDDEDYEDEEEDDDLDDD